YVFIAYRCIFILQETLHTVPKFCFPFNMDSLTVNQVGQNFTFVLTDIESKQRFGFCRLSSGAHTCYCILSYLPWFEVFYKLLNIIADYTIKGQESPLQELLVSLHTLPIQEPGVPVHLGMHSFFTVPDIRELPSIPENRNLTEYFVAVDVNNMLHLYASMLYERRVLICCSKLSTLTACVHGSAAMLYPMHWQHVYIPVLPQHLLDYCCAPMPYLIGVHSSLMEKVRGMSLDDVVILNVDTNTLETPYEDLQSLPNDVVSSLKSRLRKVSTTTGDGVARAFLKSQAALFGSYRNALQIEPGEPITFNEETFINHRSSAMKQFLQNAIQLQLFKQFIDGRLDLLNSGEGFNDIFEEEINMGEYAGSDKTYHQWLFTVKKGGGAIINTVRTKANPAMKTVYKFAKDHAKMGIKEVKSRLKQKRMDLSIGEHSRTLPGLKLSNPYNKLWSMGQDDAALPICVPPPCDRPPSVTLAEAPSPSREILTLGQDIPDLTNTSNITIPRPQGRKTPELGAVLAPPVAQVKSKPAEGRTTPGGQEFRQALSRTSDIDFLKPSKTAEDSLDLISLLDPLNSSSVNDKTENSTLSSNKPILPPRPYPTGLPPFPVQPQISLNPFASPLPQTPPQIHYSPVASSNPFTAPYRPPPLGPCLHAPQTLPVLFRQPSPGGSTVSPSYGLMHSAFLLSASTLPQSSSNHSLSSLADSTTDPLQSRLAKPLQTEAEIRKSQDPFGDLLNMVQPTATPKMKVEDLRRKWETFD
uniref:UDENN domain-containing protein n=1 Tax=Periophthalmus magnuspinnatus TaxID=409849 RepID=A0A3B3ZQC2_9GOBI